MNSSKGEGVTNGSYSFVSISNCNGSCDGAVSIGGNRLFMVYIMVRDSRLIREAIMDLWELISLLCQKVVEEQNVFLDILITPNGWEFQLMPMGEELEEGEE